MPQPRPFLWFDNQAEEAANFYVSVFPNSRITAVARYGPGSPGGAEGSVMTIAFELDGQPFNALNGGPIFQFSEAVSFVIDCETQAEVDHYWKALGEEGGQPGQCGWLKDRFGVSWQVVPTVLPRLLSGDDREKAGRAMAAMLKMKKLDIAALEAAREG
ncbi:VOC family protein [Caulobacter sp. KR2-114]|uniref:VOC family protein n=1 Tax=Caulobacter sp. KR2-114 TaxID=3400912 RepID=UPI003C03E04E